VFYKENEKSQREEEKVFTTPWLSQTTSKGEKNDILQ